jgi:hypothetical protein
MLKRIVTNLKEDGLVSAPGHGWWRWTGSSPGADPNLDEAAIDTTVPAADDFDEFQPTIRPEKEIGSGTECVYLYFNPNDRRLAELEGRTVWECKIGHTTTTDAIYRILSQGVRTALSRLPTVGLVLRTDDSAALERILHSSLRLIEAEVPDSPGTEWFMTSPARVEAWYARFQNALAALGNSSADSD